MAGPSGYGIRRWAERRRAASTVLVPRAPKMPPDIVSLAWARAPGSGSSGAQASVSTRHSRPRSLSGRTVESTVISLAKPASRMARLRLGSQLVDEGGAVEPSKPAASTTTSARASGVGRQLPRRPMRAPGSTHDGAALRRARAVTHPDDLHPDRVQALGEADEPVEHARSVRAEVDERALGAAEHECRALRRRANRRTATDRGRCRRRARQPAGISPTTPLTNMVFFDSTVA